jgi:Xaa-Pro aminopeptidase
MSREIGLYFQKSFSAAELTERRRRVTDAMGCGLAVLTAGSEVPGFDPIRQTNDFYYLTGLDVPTAYLTLHGKTGHSVLYLPPRNERLEKIDGPTLSDQDGDIVRAKTGIDEVRPLGSLVQDLSELAGKIWVMRAPAEGARQCQDSLRHFHKTVLNDPLDGRLSRETHLMARLAQLCPKAEFCDLSPIVHKLRLIKSAAEIDLMRIAGSLTATATMEAMKSTRPGVSEFQLGAIADYVFGINGAQGSGYRPIIATAGNIGMMHYWRNNTLMQSGELVLFDYAPDYNNYTSDIGRMWPVSGKYSPQQRELYGLVLQHHKILLEEIRPGRLKSEVLASAATRLRSYIEGVQWSKPTYRASALRLLESTRPLSHAVGMAVHDSADWTDEPMRPGLVFALDPEIWVPEEGLYIRVEDTVLVTDGGVENLTAACPREMDEVERLMNEPGLFQSYPAFHTNPSR